MIKMSMKINGKSASEWFDQGNKLKNRGKHHEAIACFEKVVKIDPKNKNAWKILGDLYEEIANYQKTIECYDKAEELD